MKHKSMGRTFKDDRKGSLSIIKATNNLLIFVVLNSELINAYKSDCLQAILGKPYVFQDNFEHKVKASLELLWTRNGKGVSKCIDHNTCLDYNEEKSVTSVKELGYRKFEFKLIIKRVTTEDAGSWSLNYLGTAVMEYPEYLYTCSLIVTNATEDFQTTQAIHKVPVEHKATDTINGPLSINVSTTYHFTHEISTSFTLQRSNATHYGNLTYVAFTSLDEVNTSLATIIFGVVTCISFSVFFTLGIFYGRYFFIRRRRRQLHVYESVLDLPQTVRNANCGYVNNGLKTNIVKSPLQSVAFDYITPIGMHYSNVIHS